MGINLSPSHVSIDDLLKDWDRVAFGIACRKMEVLILKGQNTLAREVFESIMRRESRERPTIDSPVGFVLPVRLANPLENAGYKTLSAVRAAKDEDLLNLPNFGLSSVDLVRETIAAVIACKPLPEADDFTDLEPEWELDEAAIAVGNACRALPAGDACRASPVGDDCRASPIPTCDSRHESPTNQNGEIKTMSMKLHAALNDLLEAGEEAVSEIDAKIEKLTKQIAQLKQVRKLLDPTPVARNVRQHAASGESKQPYGGGKVDGAVDRICDLIAKQGPLSCKEIGEKLDLDFAWVGRIVKRTPDRLVKLVDGAIDLVNFLE
jgi:hypothetical protein